MASNSTFLRGPINVSEVDLEIVGGIEASSGEFPFMVSVQDKFGNHICGASLVAEDVLLSAAHCLGGISRARLGSSNLRSESSGTTVIGISDHCKHPKYDEEKMSNDLVLFQLNRPYSSNSPSVDASIVNINKSFELHDGEQLTAIGFGSTSNVNGPVSNELREVELGYISNSLCVQKSQYKAGWIEDSMMCAGSPRKDSCSGDSGGPLIIREATVGENGETGPLLVGVCSWGMECADKNYPGVYSRVNVAYDWIKSAICLLSKVNVDGCDDLEFLARDTLCGN